MTMKRCTARPLLVLVALCAAGAALAAPVRVEFRFQHPTAYSVSLAGTFNGWDMDIDQLTGPHPEDWWTIEKPLEPGYYEYKFVTNGSQWHTDPLNPRMNPQSYNNSILEVLDPLVYYLLPKDGTDVATAHPLISANVAKSDAETFDLSELEIRVDGEVVASGASFYDPATGRATYTVVETLENGTHEVRVRVALAAGPSHEESSSFEVIVDEIPPAIAHTPPAGVPARVAVHLEFVITDDQDVVAATLFFKNANDSFYEEIAMFEGLGDVWTGTVGSGFTEEGHDLEYYVEASDGSNLGRAPETGVFSVPMSEDDVPPVIEDAFASPAIFAAGAPDDEARLSFYLSESSYVSVEVTTEAGVHRRTLLEAFPTMFGYRDLVWDGRTDGGSPVSDGDYVFHITAVDGWENEAAEVEVPVTVDADAPAGSVNVVLLFHANQNLNYQGDTANDVCFNGLLDVLRRHPQSKFMLHFSGTLLHDIGWYNFRNDPSTIDMLRAGAADGQFEIVGSTYAQNVPYSTHMWDNMRQAEVQREVIETMVGASPTAFWNAERCWKQQLVPLLAGNGYVSTWVESHILYDSGTNDPELAVRRTRLGDEDVIVFNDDSEMYMLDWAIESGNANDLIDYLSWVRSQDTYRDWVVCYCQDAESTGLWDYEGGGDPQEDWDNLNSVLTDLEATGWIKLTTFEEYLETHAPTEDLTPIVDGQANWMVGPSQAAGYDDWFDFNANAPHLSFYRDFYASLRERIQDVAAMVSPGSPGEKLVRHAIWNFVAHQFEFGCIGCGSIGCQDWQKAETLEGALLAAEATLDPPERESIENVDANGDGVLDWVIATPRDFYIVSETGGRLLRWFDLVRGEEVLGNELFMWGHYYEGWREWYGGGGTNDDVHYQDDFVWNAWNYAPAAAPFTRSYRIRKHAMNDRLSIDGGDPEAILDAEYDGTIFGSDLVLAHDRPGLEVVKRWIVGDTTLVVRYEIGNTSASSHDYELTIENELNPSLLTVMNEGRGSLAYWTGDATTPEIGPTSIGVANVVTERGVAFGFSEPPVSLAGGETVHGLLYDPSFEFSLEPLEVKIIEITIGTIATSVEPEEDVTGALRLRQNRPNPFNPVTTIEFELPERARAELSVYGASGRRIATLVDGILEAGPHTTTWDGIDDGGSPAASGVYFFRLTQHGRSTTRKGVLLR